jgi:ParB family transcriptional regulator, chromosome partitioning protein
MIRRPLGRGLDALIENTSAGAAAAPAPSAAGPSAGEQVLAVAVDRISPSRFQPRLRFDEQTLEELARAIQSQGMIEPLVVRTRAGAPDGPRYELIAGERRLRAARTAGLDSVPVIVRELDDRGALEMSLVENLAREELSAAEEGRAFKLLVRDFNMTQDQIAARIGKSRPYVSNTMRLLELPVEVLEMVVAGELSAGQVRPLLAISSPETQIAAARRIVAGRISARGAEQLAAEHRHAHSGSAPRRVDDPNLVALAESLQRALKRKVRLVRRRGKTPGRIELDYYDDNDLSALAATLTAASRFPSSG